MLNQRYTNKFTYAALHKARFVCLGIPVSKLHWFPLKAGPVGFS